MTERDGWCARAHGWLTARRLPWMAALVGCTLAFPAFRGTIEADDYVHRAVLLGKWPTHHPLWDLFTFMSADEEGRRTFLSVGLHPWWTDPELRVALFRPLTAATHWLDYALWPDNFVAQHVHSLLWYGLAVLVVAWIYRTVISPTAAAGMATLLFAVEDAHAITASWLANRNALVAVVLGGLSIVCHMRWRRQQRLGYLVLALLALAAGLLGAEAAVATLAYVIAYQLTLDEGPWRKRLLPIAPYVLVVAAWRVMYDRLGYGVHGSGLYVDPGQDPLGFLGATFVRLPVLMLSQWTQAPVDLWMAMPTWFQYALSVGGVVVCLGLSTLFVPLLRQDRTTRFWAVGMVLAAIPMCAAFPMDRLLLFPGIGAFGMLAGLVMRARGAAADASMGPWRRRVATVLLVLHLPMAALMFPGRSMTMMLVGDATRVMLTRIPSDTNVTDQTFVFVNGMDVMVFYIPLIRQIDGEPSPRRTTLLASTFDDNELRRVDERTLIIRPRHGFLAQDGDRLLRDIGHPFHAGERVERDDMQVDVTEVTADGRPAEARFTFKKPLEDPSLRWFVLVRGELEPFAPPPVGESVVVRRSSLDIWFGQKEPRKILDLD